MQRAGKKNIVSDFMKIKLHMDGTVNGKPFVVKGDGNGRPKIGTQHLTLTVQGDEPLPFAFDILSAAFQYGNRAFTEYPKEIPDYFKQSFEFGEGFSWKRTFTFEDGAICVATNDITKVGDEFRYEIRFDGVFPEDGPVMKKKTVKWEPSTEIMYMEGKVLKGEVNMALLLNDDSHYRCDFKTTYEAKTTVPHPPPYHYVNHCIEMNPGKDQYEFKLQEHAKAHSGLISASQLE